MKKSVLLLMFSLIAGCVGVPKELPVVAVSDSVRTTEKASFGKHRKDPLLKSDYVLEVLGEPTVIRREIPSEVWVYSQSGCVLFIYMDGQEDQSALVRHMEIGTPAFGVTEKDSLPCLKTAAKLR